MLVLVRRSISHRNGLIDSVSPSVAEASGITISDPEQRAREYVDHVIVGAVAINQNRSTQERPHNA